MLYGTPQLKGTTAADLPIAVLQSSRHTARDTRMMQRTSLGTTKQALSEHAKHNKLAALLRECKGIHTEHYSLLPSLL
jgi:hypothetical protein